MSGWQKSDVLMRRFKDIVSKYLDSKGVYPAPNRVLIKGDVFWENGRWQPKRPKHAHRLMKFKTETVYHRQLVLLRGRPTGLFDLFLTCRRPCVIDTATSLELKNLDPKTSTITRDYGCEIKGIGLAGSTLGAELVCRLIENNQLDYGNFKL